ncbi:MAG: endonuclease/exonuclease/phosphatase family protein [Anaerolineae bacterium]
MHLITWNLNKRRAIEPQVAALIDRQPDVIALQEVSVRNLPRLREAFAAVGYPYALDSVHADPMPRRPFVMLVSRHSLQQLDAPVLPFQQAYVSALVDMSYGQVAVHNLHVPSIGAYEMELKLRFMEGLYAHLAQPSALPRVVCGDFNSPAAELPDGTLITFSQRLRANGSYGIVRGWDRWDRAERHLLEGLRPFDLHDAYRTLHGYAVSEASWGARNKGRFFGFRLDHVLASSHFQPMHVTYLHAWREQNLSDHSALDSVLFMRIS